MRRFMLLTFAVLGWAWFELSGGTAYRAGTQGVSLFAKADPAAAIPEAAAPVEVTRADTGGAALTDLALGTGIALPRVTLRPAIAPEPGKAAAVIAPEPAKAAVITAPQTEAAVTAAVSIDFREVIGNRVNLRAGPDTGYAVVTQLVRGEAVEVLSDSGNGWVRLRALDSAETGWMSADFLGPLN